MLSPVAVLSALAVVQAALLALTPEAIAVRVVGIGAALATANVGIARLSVPGRRTLLQVLAAVIVSNLLVALAQDDPLRWRVVALALVGAYAAAAATLLPISRRGRTIAVAVVAVHAAALTIIEAMVDRRGLTVEGRWIGANQAPHTTAKVAYPVNPRGYFDADGPSPWRLETHHAGSSAALVEHQETPGTLRIAIEHADDPTPWNVQLNERGISVSSGQRYVMTFRARADRPRAFSYGVSMAHDPWESLGFYQEAALGTEWRDFSSGFTLTNGDRNARVHFDLGADSASVEIERVILRDARTGLAIRPAVPAREYSVSYRFNALGCRGGDPEASVPSARRLLVLGGDNALGFGVHETDTIAARLARMQAVAAAGDFDVLNCGQRGLSTREQEQFFSRVAPEYRPNLVLLIMSADDGRSRGASDAPSTIERMLHSVRWLRQTWRERTRVHDYRETTEALRQLADDCRQRSAALAVAILRTGDGQPWTDLVAAVSSALGSRDVPWIDLGSALLKDRSSRDLQVAPGDRHANDVAHAIAAVEIDRWLRSRGLR
jgi:hypothetical protein